MCVCQSCKPRLLLANKTASSPKKKTPVDLTPLPQNGSPFTYWKYTGTKEIFFPSKHNISNSG